MPPATCHLATTPAAADRVFSRNYNRIREMCRNVNYVNATPRRGRQSTNFRVLRAQGSLAAHGEGGIKDCKRKSPLSAVNTEESNDGGRLQVALRYF